jgi:hypothetical protein
VIYLVCDRTDVVCEQSAAAPRDPGPVPPDTEIPFISGPSRSRLSLLKADHAYLCSKQITLIYPSRSRLSLVPADLDNLSSQQIPLIYDPGDLTYLCSQQIPLISAPSRSLLSLFPVDPAYLCSYRGKKERRKSGERGETEENIRNFRIRERGKKEEIKRNEKEKKEGRKR